MTVGDWIQNASYEGHQMYDITEDPLELKPLTIDNDILKEFNFWDSLVRNNANLCLEPRRRQVNCRE